jgi:hypothetical protein
MLSQEALFVPQLVSSRLVSSPLPNPKGKQMIKKENDDIGFTIPRV